MVVADLGKKWDVQCQIEVMILSPGKSRAVDNMHALFL